MKEFDLEKAKAGAPVMTKDGVPARILCFDFKHESFPIVCAIEDEDCEILATYSKEGKITNIPSGEDLVMAPIKCKKYANFYLQDDGTYDLGEVYDNRDVAIRNILNGAGSKYIKTIEIEWEE